MNKHVARRLTEEESASARQGPMYLQLSISLGPELIGDRSMTQAELAEFLREEAEKHPNSFSSNVILHLSEHLTMDDESRLQQAAANEFSFYYRGCGSCNPGGGNYGQVCCNDYGCWCELC